MSYATPSTRTAMQTLQALCDKLHGYPSTAHTHVGSGPHYTPPDGVYTRTWAQPRKHPARDEWALYLGAETAAVAADATKRQRLSTQERTTLDEAVATMADLASDWSESQ